MERTGSIVSFIMRLSRIRLLLVAFLLFFSLRFWQQNRTVWSMIENREFIAAASFFGTSESARLPGANASLVQPFEPPSIQRGHPQPREEFRKPIRRKLSKIYYIENHPSRTAFMEQWLGQQDLLPFERVPIPNQHNDTDPLVDWREVFLSILDTHNTSLYASPQRPAAQGIGFRENNGLVLVLQDDFKVFDKTLGRLERALKWLPNDFDVARLDCFQHGHALVSQDTRRDFVKAYATEWDPAGAASCPYHGGFHALVFRASRINRIKEALLAVTTPIISYEAMDCLLGRAPSSPTDLKVYCLNFDDYHRIGCFHHLDPVDDVSNEAQLTAMRRTAALELPSTDNGNLYNEVSFRLAGEDFRYRHALQDDRSRPSPLYDIQFALLLRNQPRILVGICSAISNIARRQAIRETWGNGSAPSYFVVAGDWTDALAQEFLLYRDILWVDTPEDYKTGLTPKTMAFLHFVAEHNERVKSSGDSSRVVDYAFKTDDDMFVNIPQLELDLAQPASYFNCSSRTRHGCRSGRLWGLLGKNGEDRSPIDYYGLPMERTRPVRDNTSKFYVPTDYYPEEDFPPYCTGGGYALSQKFLTCAVREMPKMRHMWWEDVATGLLARTCGIRLSHANWDPDAIRAPGRFFEKSDHSQFSETPKRVDIAHQVTIENQFRLHQGLPVIFGADPFKVSLKCSDLGT